MYQGDKSPGNAFLLGKKAFNAFITERLRGLTPVAVLCKETAVGHEMCS